MRKATSTQSKQERRWTPWDFLFLAGMLVIGAFLVWKCRFGFANMDEAFYLCVPYRLWQGDALLTEEWHVSQLSGVLLLPALSAYLSIFQSTDGILLAFRYLCTAAQLGTGCFLYARFRKYNRYAAAVAAGAVCLYTPFSMIALSYNSMGILCLTIAWALLMTMEGRLRLQAWLAGLFFAAAVLCCPYLAALYAAYSVAALVARLRRGRTDTPFLLTGVGWGFFSVGILTAAVGFLALLLPRASIGEIVKAVPYILSDPEHPARTATQILYSYERSILDSNSAAPYALAGFAVLATALGVDKKRGAHRGVYFLTACLITAAYLLRFVIEKKYINFLMFPINLLGLFCIPLAADGNVRKLFWLGWLPGMIYSLCLHATSNQAFYAISSGSTVALTASILMACITAAEIFKVDSSLAGRLSAAALAMLFSMQLSAELYLRWRNIYWEGSLSEQKCLVDKGPEAGLYVSEDRERPYRTVLTETEALRADSSVKTILFVSEHIWLYLATEARAGTYSAWLSDMDAAADRLDAYYGLNPEKLPDGVYVDKQYEAVADRLCAAYGFTKEAGELGFVLKR